MWVVGTVIIGVLAIFIENFLDGILPINLSLFYAIGVALYLTYSHRAGLLLAILGALWQDIILYPSFPVTLAAIILSWWLWNSLINSRLTPTGFIAMSITAAGWLLIYVSSHWVMAWVPFWLNDTILYPGLGVNWSLLILSWLGDLLLVIVFIAFGRYLLRKSIW